MHRSVRSARSVRAVAAGAAVVFSLGVGMSTAVADGGPGGGSNGGGHGSGHGGGDHGANTFENAQAKLLRDVDRAVRGLDRATSEKRLRGLSAEVQSAVVANVEADKAGLALLKDQALVATTPDELKAVVVELRAYRTENYVIVLNGLRFAARLGEQVTEARVANADNPDVLAILEEVQGLLDGAVAQAEAVTATSERADVKAVKSALQEAKDLFGSVIGDGGDHWVGSGDVPPAP